MRIRRGHLTVLLNRLYDRSQTPVEVRHPSDELDTLVTLELGDWDASTVRFALDREGYATAKTAIAREYGDAVARDLPDAQDYVNAALASGVIELANHDEVAAFLDRYGDPDL